MRIGIRIDPITLEKARRDISKLTPKMITDKNGHRRKVYVKLGIPIKKDMKVNKEPWDSSTEKAKELKISDFGTLEEVRQIAKPKRLVGSREEAKAALEDIISDNGTVNRSAVELKSKNGVTALLRRSSIGKLVSGVQEGKMPKEALWQAAANIDELFMNAIEPWGFELNPHKNNDGLRDRRVLYAPMEFGGRIVPTKITVKEFFDPKLESKIYSIEAIDIDLDKKKEDAGTLTAINLK